MLYVVQLDHANVHVVDIKSSCYWSRKVLKKVWPVQNELSCQICERVAQIQRKKIQLVLLQLQYQNFYLFKSIRKRVCSKKGQRLLRLDDYASLLLGPLEKKHNSYVIINNRHWTLKLLISCNSS